MEKPIKERVSECVAITKKLVDSLYLPDDSPEIVELREHMNTYIRTGTPWVGVVDFSRWGRMAHCNFHTKAGKTIEVTLKAIPKPGTVPKNNVVNLD